MTQLFTEFLKFSLIYWYQCLSSRLNEGWIPPTLFREIEKIIPIASVDVIIIKDGKIVLTRRKIEPYKGYWHLPGSVIRRDERVIDTVKRSAKEELGVTVDVIAFVNFYELFTELRHYVSHLFIAKYKSGMFRLDFQSSDIRLEEPNKLPRHLIPVHKQMIEDALKSRSIRKLHT